MKAVIIDDLKSCRDILKLLLENNAPDITLVGEAEDIDSSYNLILQLHPDLIFLDVELGAHTCFELLDKLKGNTSKIIFTTSHDHYAIKAIRYSAFDFLLKPINEEEFNEVLDKLRSESKQNIHLQLSDLLHNFQQPEKARITLPSIKGYTIYNPSEIYHFQSDSNYAKLHLSDNKPQHISKNLKYIEGLLDNKNFIRIHREHIINKDHIKHFSSENGGYIILDNNIKLPISRRKLEEVINMLK